MGHTILIAEDDPVQRRLVEAAMSKVGYQTVTVANGADALSAIDTGKHFHAMILDLMMPEVDGLEVLKRLQSMEVRPQVIVQTAQGSMETAIRAMRAGAFDFVVKPANPERLQRAVHDALKVAEKIADSRRGSTRSAASKTTDRPMAMIGESEDFARVRKLIAKAAESDIPVLIEGESGTGKELVAQAIQRGGSKRNKPYVIVNCGAIPDNLVESILFGHEKGAFTGATQRHLGKFKEADGGTLFLDEIGELPLAVQAKLLRAIQEKQIEPVGAAQTETVNVRIISATNRDLIAAVRNGTFREDLFYRLSVFPIIMPPLRNRLDDIAPLTRFFLDKFSQSEGKQLSIDDASLALLRRYDWPGNIRQLENTLFRAAVLTDTGMLTPADFLQIANQVNVAGSHNAAEMDALRQERQNARLETRQETPSDPNAVLKTQDGHLRALNDIEAYVIRMAIEHYAGQMSEVARRLGIGRSTLYRKIKDYKLEA